MTERVLEARLASQPGPAEFIGLIALMTSLTAVSIDALLPALHDMGRSLQVSDARDLQLVISIFIAGMVLGELVFGPLSDAIGRKRAIVIGLSVYVLGTLVAISAESLLQVLVGRVIQGVGVAGPKIATRALVRDLYAGEEMARIMSFVFSVMILVPMVAPALGQAVLDASSWQGIFALYLGLAATAAVWLVWRQPETLPAERRVAPDPRVMVANARTIMTDGRVMALVVAAGAVFGAFILYLANSQAIFRDVYGVTREFPLYFASLSVAIGAAAFLNARLVRRFGTDRLSRGALVAMLALGLVFLAGSLVADAKPSLGFFMACCFGIFGCLGVLFGNLNAMAMESLGHVAGLGSSLIASISSVVAVVLAVSVGRLYDGTVLVLNVGFLVGAAIALTCIVYAIRPSDGAARG